MNKKSGFTLIELLIVIAIIAILALIAVPNFLEAQVRAKLSRCMADMRSIATAMESYMMDNGAVPPDLDGMGVGISMDEGATWAMLTTPLAYITSIPIDVFHPDPKGGTNTAYKKTQYYQYWAMQDYWPANSKALWQKNNILWFMNSVGPDSNDDALAGAIIYPGGVTPERAMMDKSYDPTNGTVSNGDIGWSNIGAFPGGFRFSR